MTGIFGDLFDFNNDGKLNSVEQAADFLEFERIMHEDEPEPDLFLPDDTDIDCDTDG